MKIRFVGWVLLVLLGCLVCADEAYAVFWKKNLPAALKEAERSRKPVMVDFYTDWCGWCKKLDKVVYRDRKFKEMAKKFICVKVNCDNDKKSAGKYNIKSYPTILFLDSDGNVVGKIDGYAEADYFVRKMDAVLKKTKPRTKTKPVLNIPQIFKNKKKMFKKKISKKKGSFELNGINYDSRGASAFINGKYVTVGSTVSGANVIEITPIKVKLLHEGKEIIRKLGL